MSHRARQAATLTLAVALLVSCSGPETSDRGGESAPTRPGDAATGSPSPTPGPDDPDARLPQVPAQRATTLARQLDLAGATLRQRDAAPRDVRRAAEFHQLAVRALAGSPADFRTRVIARLQPATARSTGSDLRAARFLLAMSSPQPKLPRWRIVAPPPPAELLRLYRRAQRRTGVPWNYLAAIHLVETRMGRIRGTSTAGALGPMQFLPTTWDLYGAGGDINDPRDAILAAARLLKHHGAPDDMAGAVWHYNPSDNYVGAVLEYARHMQRSPAAYDGYWHWRVLYTHTRGTHVLPVGYPTKRAVPLPPPTTTPPASLGTRPPPWLGTRVLPTTAQGYGEVRPTPPVMRVRRWNTGDAIPALPGTGFRAVVTDPAPERVIARSTWRRGCPVDKRELAWIRLTYWGFDHDRHSGEMLVNGSVTGDLVAVFRRLYRARFPIESMGIARLVDLDAPPTGDGNGTGSFACRPMRGGTAYSQHAYGLAVDVNPFHNPYRRGDVVLPELASAYLDRNRLRPGMITAAGPVVRAFASIGWEWGGGWTSLKDYQHFSLTGR